jgi:hypothetical protein
MENDEQKGQPRAGPFVKLMKQHQKVKCIDISMMRLEPMVLVTTPILELLTELGAVNGSQV